MEKIRFNDTKQFVIQKTAHVLPVSLDIILEYNTSFKYQGQIVQT